MLKVQSIQPKDCEQNLQKDFRDPRLKSLHIIIFKIMYYNFRVIYGFIIAYAYHTSTNSE